MTAVRFLELRAAVRRPAAPVRPATDLFPPVMVGVLGRWRYRTEQEPLMVPEFGRARARLGGPQNRIGDGFPGWITLWPGWSILQSMGEAVPFLQDHPDEKSSG